MLEADNSFAKKIGIFFINSRAKRVAVKTYLENNVTKSNSLNNFCFHVGHEKGI